MLIRAKRVLYVPAVPNMAHDSPAWTARVWPSPAFWNVAAPKVAMNSIEIPGEYDASVFARAPSTVSKPPETVEAPPPPQAVLDQPGGRAAPPNSALTVGVRITSPFAIWETAVFAPGVPAEKSATVVSPRLGAFTLIVTERFAVV